MKINFPIVILISLLFFFQGCVNKKIEEARNLVECEYTFHSISQVNLDGMDFSEGVNRETIAQAISLLTNSSVSVPLSMTVNLNVTNPTPNNAAIQGLDYILQIDNIEFTHGSLVHSINVAPGDTQVLPVRMEFDLITLLNSNSQNAVENIVRNLLGIGDEEVKFYLQIKPYLRVAGRTVSQDHYIPINFTFKNQ